MPIGPETHRVLRTTPPMSCDSSQPHYIFPSARVDRQEADPTVVIETITSTPDSFIKDCPFLFSDEGGFGLALWKNSKNESIMNFLLTLYPQVTQETQNFFQRLVQEKRLKEAVSSTLFPICHFISEGDHAGLRLEQIDRYVFEILPDGLWRGDNFSSTLNLKRKPFCFEFVATRIHLRSGETTSLVGGLSFESTDFVSLNNRLKELIIGDAPVKETEMREIINPYVRLLGE